MKYLLDTNICIALIRRKSPAILNHLLSHQPGEIGISSISLAELSFGVEKSTQVEQNKSALQQFLLALELAEFDQPAAFRYGKIRAELERAGQLIGSMDMLIGAHAVSLDAILVTNNIREFQRINGLILEDWMDVTG
jgi:tRNA(fMet)-specific endonuclease VapC